MSSLYPIVLTDGHDTVLFSVSDILVLNYVIILSTANSDVFANPGLLSRRCVNNYRDEQTIDCKKNVWSFVLCRLLYLFPFFFLFKFGKKSLNQETPSISSNMFWSSEENKETLKNALDYSSTIYSFNSQIVYTLFHNFSFLSKKKITRVICTLTFQKIVPTFPQAIAATHRF